MVGLEEILDGDQDHPTVFGVKLGQLVCRYCDKRPTTVRLLAVECSDTKRREEEMVSGFLLGLFCNDHREPYTIVT